MRQGDIWLMEPPFEVARPVIVISRNWAISHLNRVVVAPITRTIRSTETIISVGRQQGLRYESVATFDNLASVSKSQLTHQIGALSDGGRKQMCDALHAIAEC
ncbi:type II toxin-antitoxin system PemK/MazF family toxin [Candidatus Poriferisocius sp.]|uniref:type II toxin-antitoxin system PemK/MazF family toxin n=1 Tax=Candidatus Poriferisocius sp. TaxID=3101276 RepID=UPI003B52C61A